MIEITLDDRVVQLPEHLTIQKYQEMNKKIEVFKQDSIKLLAFYMGIDEFELKDLPVNDVEFIQNYITERYTNINSQQVPMVFEFNGVEYGLETDWSKFSWGAWIDLEVLSQENIIDNINHIMGILYRPIESKKGTKYTLTKYKSKDVQIRKELFKELPVQYWLGVSNFFFHLSILLIENTKSSLLWKMKWNRLLMKGWEHLPKCLRKRLPLDSILIGLSPSQKKISQGLNI